MDKNLARVEAKIGPLVKRFCKTRVNKTFHMADLAGYVQKRVAVAPNSPYRILRYLEEEGELGYVVLSRSASLYQVLWVR